MIDLMGKVRHGGTCLDGLLGLTFRSIPLEIVRLRWPKLTIARFNGSEFL